MKQSRAQLSPLVAPNLYRTMENLSEIDLASLPLSKLREMTLSEVLMVPFSQLTLLRPLRLFKSALGLSPGVAAAPDPDFIVVLLQGAPHQSLLREQMEGNYKNLENTLRGLHVASATTAQHMQTILGVDAAMMQNLIHGNKDGHLMPQYVIMFQLIEGLFYQCFRMTASAVLTCKCCKGNVLADMDAWWARADLKLLPDAYTFVDRLLKVVVGAEALMGFFDSSSRPAPGVLEQIVSPETHPIGQWMELVRRHRGDEHLWQISMVDGIAQQGEGSVPKHRIAKWKSGQDLLPLAKARLMIRDIPHEASLDNSLLAARVFALAIDVVRSTAVSDGYPTRHEAQQVIAKRYAQLKINLRLSIKVMLSHARTA